MHAPVLEDLALGPPFFFFLIRIIVHRGSLPRITLYFLDMTSNVTKAPCGLILLAPGVRVHHHSRAVRPHGDPPMFPPPSVLLAPP